MSEFNIRSESVDVEQIMKQIRQRILEKRGADYTEEEIRELASVRLEKFLDPNNLRSDLLEQFRNSRPAAASEPPVITPPYTAEQTDIFATHRGIVRLMRKLFAPLLKLMFNANTLHQVLHTQSQFNVDLLKREARRKIEFDRSRAEWNSLYYEVLHNLVLETTRMGIEVQNLRMKVESLSSRLDFSERRVRALEGVVQYRPEVVRSSERHTQVDEDHGAGAADVDGRPRRLRARRGRRSAGSGRRCRTQAPPPPPRTPARRTGGSGCAGCAGCTGCTGATVRRVRKARFGQPEAVTTTTVSTTAAKTTTARTSSRWTPAQKPRRRWKSATHSSHRMHLMHPTHPTHPWHPMHPLHPDPCTRCTRFRQRRSVKVAVVVQRYGADINGGAEQHARYVAEHLAKHVQVEVLTTCAHRDYISWKNELPEGLENVHGIPVHRFPVAFERNPVEFAKWSDKVFTQHHSLRDELAWLDAEGPTSPALIEHIKKHEADYDFFIFFSFRYHHSFHGCRAVASKAILVPTAERDNALGLGLYPPIFRGVRAFMYNSYEERALIQAVSRNESVPSVVVGVGSEIPERSNGGALPAEVRDARSLRDLRRADRREQGLRRAVRILRALQRFAGRRDASRADRHGAHPDSDAPADSSPRVPRGPGQVRRDGGGGAVDHAVVPREPFDGGARSVGDGQAGARQRQVRRAAGPMPAQQRRAVLRELSRVRGDDAARSIRRPACRRRSARMAAPSSRRTTRGR